MPSVALAVPTPVDRPEPNFVVDPAAPSAPPAGSGPLATFPRRIDGRAWELLTSRAGVTAMGGAGRLAVAQVAEDRERVVVDIRPDVPVLPADLGALLVAQAFAHPAVRARRPALVTLPRGESGVLEEVLAHLDGASARVAGVTCLVEGRVRAAAC